MSRIKSKDLKIFIGGSEVICLSENSINIPADRSGIVNFLRLLQYKEKLEGLTDDEKHDKQECLNELKRR